MDLSLQTDPTVSLVVLLAVVVFYQSHISNHTCLKGLSQYASGIISIKLDPPPPPPFNTFYHMLQFFPSLAALKLISSELTLLLK